MTTTQTAAAAAAKKADRIRKLLAKANHPNTGAAEAAAFRAGAERLRNGVPCASKADRRAEYVAAEAAAEAAAAAARRAARETLADRAKAGKVAKTFVATAADVVVGTHTCRTCGEAKSVRAYPTTGKEGVRGTQCRSCRDAARKA